MLLTDGYIANAAEPWKVPDMGGLRAVPGALVSSEVPVEGARQCRSAPRPRTLAAAWIKPGTPGLAPPHRRHREAAPAPATSNMGPPTIQGMTEIRARQGARRHGARSRPGGVWARRAASLSSSAGARPLARSTRQCGVRVRGAATSAMSISGTSGRCRAIWRPAKGLRADPRTRDEHGTARRRCCATSIWSTPKPLNKISGQPFKIAEIEAAIEEALAPAG